MKQVDVTYKTRNVNSKQLLKSFQDIIDDIRNVYITQHVSLFDYSYDFTALVDFIEMYLQDLVDKKVITQFDVIGDKRINDEFDVKSGLMKVQVKFRQTHCLNVTEIMMTFTV